MPNEGLSCGVEDRPSKHVPVPLTGGAKFRLTCHDRWS